MFSIKSSDICMKTETSVQEVLKLYQLLLSGLHSVIIIQCFSLYKRDLY